MFNQFMTMENHALSDKQWQSGLRNDQIPYDIYKTRLVRFDLASFRGARDPLRHSLRRYALSGSSSASDEAKTPNKPISIPMSSWVHISSVHTGTQLV